MNFEFDEVAAHSAAWMIGMALSGLNDTELWLVDFDTDSDASIGRIDWKVDDDADN